MTSRTALFDLRSEQGVLRISIAVTLCIAVIGIGFGVASGSFSIVFDGVYSLVDASMSALSLVVVRLITSYATSRQLPRKLRERFTMGFWHLEPMVLALNGILLSGVAVYALINAVSSLLKGGRDLEFGLALVYAVLTLTACVAIALAEARANRRIRSAFLHMDLKGWIMSASITAALPMSLACLDRTCHSGPMRSTTASMPLLSSSTISTSKTVPASSATSIQLLPSQKAAGISTMAASASWRKAFSFHPARRPDSE